jgi:dihydrofolate synthase/folylpolyglutamate synthase
MLADKDVAGVVAAMADTVDRWYAASLSAPRGLSAKRLAEELRNAGIYELEALDDVPSAMRQARGEAMPGDRIVVFGSFHTAAEALELGVRMGTQPC